MALERYGGNTKGSALFWIEQAARLPEIPTRDGARMDLERPPRRTLCADHS